MALLALGAIVAFASATQAMTGFGSVVIAVALGAWVIPIEQLVPILVAVNLPLNAWFVARDHAAVDRGVLLRRIAPLMATGTVVGLLIAPWLAGDALRRAFGALVVLAAGRDLWLTWGAGAVGSTAAPAPVFAALVLGAGITHGLWGSGGPLLVMATSRLGLDRAAYRATLMVVWLAMGVIVLAGTVAAGAWDATQLGRAAALFPAGPIGLVIGDRLHAVVPERPYRAVVQVVLLLSGLALITR